MLKPRSFIHNRKLRFAVVGCGRISGKHFEAITKNSDNCELVAICDQDPKALELTTKKLNIPSFARLEDLLEKSNADVVVLTTPSGLHAEQAIQVAAAKKHVMTEKPMATRWADGQRMVQACDEAGVFLFVVKQNRNNPTLQLLKSAVDKNRFGRIYMMSVNVFWSRPQEYYDSSAWRGTWEFDGGALMNQASHYIDLLDWLVGPIESVQASIATLARNIEVEDTATLSVKWRSGALGSVNVTMLTHNKNFEGSVTILGEKGTVRLGGVAANHIDHWEFDTPDPDDARVKDANYDPQSVYGHGHIPYYRNVVNALRGEQAPLTDGREGLKSLEVLIAGYISARDGHRVSLPLQH